MRLSPAVVVAAAFATAFTFLATAFLLLLLNPGFAPAFRTAFVAWMVSQAPMALVPPRRMFRADGGVTRGRRRAFPVLEPLAELELLPIHSLLCVLVSGLLGLHLFPIFECQLFGFASRFAGRFLPARGTQGP